MKMAKSVIFITLLFALTTTTSFAGTVVPRGASRCPYGMYFRNVGSGETLFNYRFWKTCNNPEATSCVNVTFSYRLPYMVVGAELDLGCVSNTEEHAADLNELVRNYPESYPFSSIPVDSGYTFCDDPDECVDFTPPAERDDGLRCHYGTMITDDDTKTVLKEHHTIRMCKEHHTGCRTSKIQFITQDSGRPATFIARGCNDKLWNYDFAYSRFYPHTSKDKDFCQKHGCTKFQGASKEMLCMCRGDSKIRGMYSMHVTTECNSDLCNQLD